MHAILERNLEQIVELCKLYRVERLDVFGSAATSRFDEAASDLDFIVRFEAPTEAGVARRYLELAEQLEKVLERPIDLLTDRGFRNPFFEEAVGETRSTVYARDQRSQEVSV